MFGGFVFGGAVFGGGSTSVVAPAVTRRTMAWPPLTAPNLGMNLAPQFPSLCTIQTLTPGQSLSGQLISAEGIDVTGLEGIPCRIAALANPRSTDNEVRSATVLESYNRRTCKLNGYYPDIIPRQMRAVVDGVPYNIRGIEHDSEHCFTRLTLEVLLPNKTV